MSVNEVKGVIPTKLEAASGLAVAPPGMKAAGAERPFARVERDVRSLFDVPSMRMDVAGSLLGLDWSVSIT